jgi:uncharacterized caspase-like protein
MLNRSLLSLAFLCFGIAASSASAGDVQARRVALVVGNNAYPMAPLQNAVNDAIAVAKVLETRGFKVQRYTDLNWTGLGHAIDQFVSDLRTGDIVLLYYSGHGMQIDGENYIIPTSFSAADEAGGKRAAYSAEQLLERVNARNPLLTILILDACRSNPFRPDRSLKQGLAAMEVGRGTYIAFATSPGSTASDNPNGQNGLFTTQLLTALQQPGLELDQVFGWVRKQVFTVSKGAQLPWTSSSVIGDFYFDPNVPTTAQTARMATRDLDVAYAAGVRSLSAGRYQEALALLESASRMGKTHTSRSSSFSQEKSIATLQAVVDRSTGELRSGRPVSGTLAQRGIAYLLLGKYDSAISDFSALLDAEGADITVYRLRGQALVLTNRPSGAIDDLSRAIDAGHGDWRDYCLRSIAFSQEQRFQEALIDAKKAVDAAPQSVGLPLCARANVEYALGRLTTALMDAQACIRRDPASHLGYEVTGNILRARGELGEAARMYRRTIELELTP